MPRSRLPVTVLIVFLASFTTGCVRTETVPVRYRIPLDGNSHGPEVAASCAAACRTANAVSEGGFFACIGTCPDAEVLRDAACSDDAGETPPQALCFTRLVEQDVPDPAVANFLGELIGAIAEAGVRAAVHGGEHHEHGHGHGKTHREKSPPPRPSRAERRVAAEPHRGR